MITLFEILLEVIGRFLHFQKIKSNRIKYGITILFFLSILLFTILAFYSLFH